MHSGHCNNILCHLYSNGGNNIYSRYKNENIFQWNSTLKNKKVGESNSLNHPQAQTSFAGIVKANGSISGVGWEPCYATLSFSYPNQDRHLCWCVLRLEHNLSWRWCLLSIWFKKEEAKQARLNGGGQQEVWMYAGQCVTPVWGECFRVPHKGRGIGLIGLDQILVLYSSGNRCGKPTLFFFLWSSTESLSSASSASRSETCLSFSVNLTNNNITTHCESLYSQGPLKTCGKSMCYDASYGMQHYLRW